MEAAMKSAQETERDSRDAFDNSFDVPLPPAEAWPVLTDIRRIAQCVPGAKLTEVVDDRTYHGTISVPLGPVALGFAGVMKFEELDPANQTARVTAQGESKGSGDAHATASFQLEPAAGGSKVLVHMEVMLSGGVARYGGARGIIRTTANQMINQFAANLRAQVSGAEARSR
jgi:carbon monoxide dehydrogenase subunit G